MENEYSKSWNNGVFKHQNIYQHDLVGIVLGYNYITNSLCMSMFYVSENGGCPKHVD
jgi:hypothetical protein